MLQKIVILELLSVKPDGLKLCNGPFGFPGFCKGVQKKKSEEEEEKKCTVLIPCPIQFK